MQFDISKDGYINRFRYAMQAGEPAAGAALVFQRQPRVEVALRDFAMTPNDAASPRIEIRRMSIDE